MKKGSNTKDSFKGRVHHFAKKIGVKVRTLALRPMKKKWASCSTAGNMNFNVELLSVNQQIGDYVIVHELLHFKAPNHSKLWKSLMLAYLGDYEQCEKQLTLLECCRQTSRAGVEKRKKGSGAFF